MSASLHPRRRDHAGPRKSHPTGPEIIQIQVGDEGQEEGRKELAALDAAAKVQPLYRTPPPYLALLPALTESRRRAVFATLVGSQDKGASVRQSRQLATVRFGVTMIELPAIEREGLDNRWPPLQGAS
jgi:hypothetical protein